MKDSIPVKILRGFLIIILLFLLIVAVAVITLGFMAPDKLYSMPVIGSVMNAMNGNSNANIDENEEPEEIDDEDDNEKPTIKTKKTSKNKKDNTDTEDDSTLNVSINEEDVDLIPYENEISELLVSYAPGINRVDGNEYNLENNTMLVYIAKNYFDSKNSASVDIDTKYAATKDNIHKFLSELTDKDYTSMNALSTFSNFIRYTEKTGSYAIGKDINLLKREKYTVSDITFEEAGDGQYSGTAVILRSLDNGSERELTHYAVDFRFSINERFTYSKYKILDFNAANKDYMPDNTFHIERN